MKKFYVDFQGYCTIEAENVSEVEQKFYELIEKDMPLPSNIYEIDGIEEIEDE